MKSKKMITGKIVSAALIFALSASLTACGSNTENNTDKSNTESSEDAGASSTDTEDVDINISDKEKEFSTDDMKITLNEDFSTDKLDNFDMYVNSNYCIGLFLKETKDEVTAADGSLSSLDDYVNNIMTKSQIKADVSEYNENTRFFSWDKEINDTTYKYAAYASERGDSYYLVQFVTTVPAFDKLKDTFNKFYDSFEAN